MALHFDGGLGPASTSAPPAPPAAPTLTVERDDGAGAVAATQFFTADATWSFAGEEFIFTVPLPTGATGVAVIGYPDGFGPDDAEAVTLASDAGLTAEVVSVDTLAPMADVATYGVTWHVIARATGPGGSTDSAEVDLTIDLTHLTSYSQPTSYTWTEPTGGIYLHLDGTRRSAFAAATASGAGGVTNTGGGGAGAFASTKASTTGNVSATVATGGAAGGSAGASSSFGSSTIAEGGGGDGTFSHGGRASASTGDTKFDGGAGDLGTLDRQGGGAGSLNGAGVLDVPGEPYGGAALITAAGTFGAGGSSRSGSSQSGGRGNVSVLFRIPATPGRIRRVGQAMTRTLVNSTQTSHAFTLPAGSGGRNVLKIACDGIPTVSATGWTALTQASDASNAVTVALLHIVSTGSEAASITTSAGEWLACVCDRWVTYAGGVPASPTWTTTSATGANAQAPTHTPAAGSAAYWWESVVAWNHGAGGTTVTAYPSGYTSHRDVPPNRAAGGGGTRILCSGRFATGTSESPGATTSASEAYAAGTLSMAEAV